MRRFTGDTRIRNGRLQERWIIGMGQQWLDAGPAPGSGGGGGGGGGGGSGGGSGQAAPGSAADQAATPPGRNYTGRTRIRNGRLQRQFRSGMALNWEDAGPAPVNPTTGQVTSNSREADVILAYQEVLGRNPDPGGLINYVNSGMTGAELRRHLASSEEARNRGVDPTTYGATIVDVTKLSGSDREHYEAWQQHNPGKTYYSTDKQYMGWVKQSMNLTTWEAQQNGLIYDVLDKDDKGNDILVRIVTPQANAFAASRGEQLLFVGSKSGEILSGDFSNAKLKWYNMGEADERGYQTGVALGAPKSGVFGEITDFFEDLGMNKDWASTFTLAVTGGLSVGQFTTEVLNIKEGYFLADPFNIASGTLYGREGYMGNIAGGANIFNTSEENFAQAQGIASSVLMAAVSVAVPWAGVALNALKSTSQYQAGLPGADGSPMSAGDVVKSIALNAATTYVGGTYFAQSSMWAQASINAVGSGFLGSKLQGLSTEDSLRNAGAAFLGSVVGSTLNTGLSSLLPSNAAALQGLSTTFSNLASAGAQSGLGTDSLNTEGWIASAAGATLAGFARASQISSYYEKNPIEETVGPVDVKDGFSFDRAWESLEDLYTTAPRFSDPNVFDKLEVDPGYSSALALGGNAGVLTKDQQGNVVYANLSPDEAFIQSALNYQPTLKDTALKTVDDLKSLLPVINPLGYLMAYGAASGVKALGESSFGQKLQEYVGGSFTDSVQRVFPLFRVDNPMFSTGSNQSLWDRWGSVIGASALAGGAALLAGEMSGEYDEPKITTPAPTPMPVVTPVPVYTPTPTSESSGSGGGAPTGRTDIRLVRPPSPMQ